MTVSERLAVLADSVIEEGQTLLMFQEDYSRIISFSIHDLVAAYDDIDFEDLRVGLIEDLKTREIRLFREESDEAGVITGSEEGYTTMFEEVALEEGGLITLTYSQEMMDLLV